MNVQARARRLSLFTAAAACAAAALVWTGPAANAAVIYSDDFSGDGSDLQGAAPDVAPGGETWAAGPAFNQNGTVTTVGSAYLPFVPQSGQVYNVSVNVNVTQATDSFIGLGFTRFQGDLGARFFAPLIGSDAQAVFWIMSRGTDASPLVDQSFLGPGTVGGENGPVNSSDMIGVELDTTAATWTVRWSFNGVVARTVTGITPDNAISYVALTSSNTAGTVDNFSLTAVPEPGIGAAMFAGAGLLARRGRRARPVR